MIAEVRDNRRKEQLAATRARLFDLAWEMVRDAGPTALSIRELASRAGVATGLPFAHFGSREGLLDQLRVRVWDRLDLVITGAISAAPTTGSRRHEARVRAGVTAVVAWALAEPHLYALVALVPGEMLSETALSREVRTAQPFVQFLYEGQAAGEFAFDRDPAVFALALWTSVQGYIMRMGARLPDMFRIYQAAVLDEILDAFFARARRTSAEVRA